MSDMVSIIVPVYNVEKYLVRCIESIRSQTYTKLEIILVNDGSTDSSGKACNQYALLDERIKVIHKQNGGLSSARNAGINDATGKFLMFIDSDDFISKDCVNHLLGILEENNANIAVGNYVRTCENEVMQGENISKEEITCLDGRQAVSRLSYGNNTQMVTAWGKLYRKNLFDDIRYPEGLLHEDEGTTYKLYYECDTVVVSNKVVYGYFYNPNSIMSNPKAQNFKDTCRILDEQIDFFEQKKESILADQIRNKYCIYIMAHILPLNYYGSYKELKMKIKNIYREIDNKEHLEKKMQIKAWLCRYIPLGIAVVLRVKHRIKLFFNE